jgi:hypothetical protein
MISFARNNNLLDKMPFCQLTQYCGLGKEKGPSFRMTVYVDADHAYDLVTRRSITGILVILNNMPIRWISKRQKTVETSNYGSELVASRSVIGWYSIAVRR